MIALGRRIPMAAVILSLILWMGCTLKRSPDIGEDYYYQPPPDYYGYGYGLSAPPPPQDGRYDASWEMFRYYDGERWEYPLSDRPGYRPQTNELRERISRSDREMRSRAPVKPESNSRRTERVRKRAKTKEDEGKKDKDEEDRREKLRKALKRRRD